MLAMIPSRPAVQRGFTLLESMVAIAVLGVLLAVGMPNMRDWLSNTAASGAAQFYAEGYRLAKGQALANNSRSRLVFTENQTSGQLDWQVDVCFPTADDACGATSARWSNVGEPADTPGNIAVQTDSVFRSSAGLPSSSAVSVTPEGEARTVYFTELGWVDGGKPALTRIDLAPANTEEGSDPVFPPSAVVLTLAGAVVVCRPDFEAGNSRSCP